MMTAITKFYMYFGIIGIASTLAWLICWITVVIFAISKHRTKALWITLGMSIVGLWLAGINSLNVSAIKLDQTEEIQAGRKQAQELLRIKTDDTKDDSIYAQAAAGAEPANSYKSRGKQTRTKDTKRDDAMGDQLNIETNETRERTMKAADRNMANMLDRLNLFFSRTTFWFVILFVMLDYLHRFNKTFKPYFPLPVSCHTLDTLFPKPNSICIRKAKPNALADYLQTTVRKGDTFIYFGQEDPWGTLSTNGGVRSILPRLFVPGLKHGLRIWGLEKYVVSNIAECDSNFLFESVWFRRLCAVVKGAPISAEHLNDLLEFMRLRHTALATAKHTVHIVWDHAMPPPRQILVELLF
ncbi:MAG: hypothetical protein JXN60_05025, partial [Lentisphaerae bacterium]|nr:hypothetical protein [Lentisphaerota bacterium]